MEKSVIIIPSHLKAKRLPNKPLLDINGLPLILHVLKNSQKSDIKKVYVATPDDEISNIIIKNQGEVIKTGNHHTNGTDRIFEALNKIQNQYDIIINIQGDMPNINKNTINKLNEFMIKNSNIEVATIAGNIKKEDYNNPNVVKVRTSKPLDHGQFNSAIDFFRTPEKNNTNIYHHIGIYAFRKSMLKKFVDLKKSKNEISRSLEQMRLIDNNIDIKIGLTKYNPLSVDTVEDLNNIRKLLK
jgi:3-deoxy-manno-octulosonate cytidylyltransferase (CMP-KDO synthetase)